MWDAPKKHHRDFRLCFRTWLCLGQPPPSWKISWHKIWALRLQKMSLFPSLYLKWVSSRSFFNEKGFFLINTRKQTWKFCLPQEDDAIPQPSLWLRAHVWVFFCSPQTTMIFSKLSESERANIAELRLGFGNAAGEELWQSLSKGMDKAALVHSRETSRESEICQGEREGEVQVRGEASWDWVCLGSTAGWGENQPTTDPGVGKSGPALIWGVFLSKVLNELWTGGRDERRSLSRAAFSEQDLADEDLVSLDTAWSQEQHGGWTQSLQVFILDLPGLRLQVFILVCFPQPPRGLQGGHRAAPALVPPQLTGKVSGKMRRCWFCWTLLGFALGFS